MVSRVDDHGDGRLGLAALDAEIVDLRGQVQRLRSENERLLRLLDAAVDNRLSRAGTLERHTAVVQAAVLREELPTLVAELERDAARGAWVTPEATAFA